MVDFALTEEQQQLRALAHEFAEKEIVPKAPHHDQTGEFPRDICRKAWDLGLMNTHVPEAYGGPGLGVLDGCMIAEEVAWGCTGIGTAMEANTLAEAPVIVGGSDEQKKRFLTPMTKEFKLAAYCVTEPQAGSDVQGIKTVARKVGEDYVLKGSKMWITNGSVADWYFVFAYTDPAQRYKGMSAFVGKEGQGWFLAMAAFDHSRPVVSAAAVGLARSAMEHPIRYAKERTTFGVPIHKHQSIAFTIAEMAMKIEAARLLVWQSAWKIDRGERNTREAAFAKAFAADSAMEVALNAVQVFGGYGYSREYPVEKLMRDAKIFQIYEGTSQIQRLIIAKEIFERS